MSIASAIIESVVEVDVEHARDRGSTIGRDVLAVEEPLEIRVNGQAVSVTMRTPGDDDELAAGYLFTEGIVRDRRDILAMHRCGGGNVLRVELSPAADLTRLARRGYTSSSCGVCGKTSLDTLAADPRFTLPADSPMIRAELVLALSPALRDAQAVFDATGGLHASALFDTGGRLRLLREDVGRHNALDKVIGAELLAGNLPAHERIVLVSGRASFELVQKAAMAALPILAAIGAPSSLAVQLARRCGMTLLGFVRDGRFNVYAGSHRLARS